ncbi:hypothetical protein F511_28245 [Dorcoceras hygrometricum]|uniref:Uncharacterized protein n=1 Tax=Dorcoceras hygrometricum TaxID=472368 RepID=A0A2Z7AGU8_9LAMI|nr:hypothetical protein F511_28245 [Dorcoceras hygrometricum]
MPPRRARDQQEDDTPPPPRPPQMTLYERDSVDMLAGITRMLERQSERPGKSHEEDVAPGFDQFHEETGTTNDSIGYPRMRASGESSTTKHRLLHASGPHPIPPPNDPKSRKTASQHRLGYAGMRSLQYLRSVATVPAFGRYSTCVRSLQYLCSAATVPAFGRYSACVRPLQCPRAAATAPGSDQFHEETGTSNARTDSPRRGDRNKSDHAKNRATATATGGDGRSAAA